MKSGAQPWEKALMNLPVILNPDEGTNYYADWVWHYLPDYFFNTASNRWTPWQPGDGPNNGGREMIYQNIGGQKNRYLPDFRIGWPDGKFHP